MTRKFFCLVTSLFLFSCAGAPPTTEELRQELTLPAGVERVWSQRMPGLITDLNLVSSARLVLISMVPDPDRLETTIKNFEIHQYGFNGDKRWAVAFDSQIRNQSIGEDGQFVAVSTYAGDLTGIDSSGKKLWTVETNCRPVVFSRNKRVFCYHDDDAEPGVAFEVFDYAGKKLSVHRVKRDVLAFKTSYDRGAVVLGFAGGHVQLFDDSLKMKWDKKIPGEVIDVAVSSGKYPNVGVLYATEKGATKAAVFDSRGQALSAGHAPFHSDQIEVLPEKETAVLYGNSPKGQNLALLNDEKGQLKETWKQTQARFADYTSTMLLIGDRIIIGLEESSRASALTAFDLGGRATWKIPLLTEESAYLFAPSVTNDKLWVSVGTDDSVLTLFEVTLR